ncbi:MAG: thioesterase family protein [Fluviicoccus sp.]|uniref:acyl-CoA thioesterase n=1 Tax=Fluviicoccus sp. TaxID=2003552 RepID=UPI00271A0C4B|nr:thioesterase family protein [Fluviicoccus sp.]MDO8331388.1 thioesterase family protein [Fluviicoccus sp.]
MFTTAFSPRFYETDAFGHVNNTVVTGWFETAREPIFRIFTPDMDIKALSMILARVEVDYVAQIHYGSEVTVNTGIEKIGNSSFTVWHEAFQKGVVVARGRAVQVHFDFAGQKSSPLPEHLRLALEQHLSPV